MEKRTLGKTGLSVSVLGFGAAPAAFLKAEAEKTTQMLNGLLDAGLNLIDTAAMYPGSEQFIGDHLSRRRKDFVLVSKCGTKVDGLIGDPFSAELISQSVDRALRLLKTDVIDVMLLHSCDMRALETGEAIQALIHARDAGKIRFLGYSGDNQAAAYAATIEDVSVLEMSINIVDQFNIDHGLAAARQENIGVIAKRPIANAAWKDISSQPGMYQGYAKTYTERFAKMGLNLKDLGVPQESASAWPGVALRFTLSQPGVCTAIVGTTNPANAQANVQAARSGPLTQSQIAAIRSAFAKADTDGHWSGQQ